MRLIRSWNLPVIDHLPTLEAEEDLAPQDGVAVARRCVVIIHIIMIAFGCDSSELGDAVEEFGLMDYTTATERDMLSRADHTDQEKIDAEWLVECMQGFAWCLGLAELDHTKHADDDLASSFPEPFDDPSGFIRSATLRPFQDIYRQADLLYRLHWAARNARLSGNEFPLSESLLKERRRALDWVIGVEPDWDEVPSDT